MKQHLIDRNQAAKVCLELAGGGYTVQQTAKAMEWQHTLLETGELRTRKFHLKLKEDDDDMGNTVQKN